DASQGRKTKGVIFSTDGRVILSALVPETIAGRLNTEKDLA
ncbi:MAG: extracellular matrix/biofilm biosynthesis regulator RemA family protein, partial [Candidatus Weimeria sp.]